MENNVFVNRVLDSRLGQTSRTDNWWLEPLLIVAGLGAFLVYSSWAGMQGAYYYYEPYLSPFYSPLIFIKTGVAGGAPLSHAWLGEWPAWWPETFLTPATPAILILIFPGAFRLTCYYYRKSYYRAFTWSPPACAVGPVHQNNFKGETGLLTFQNIHRYALYFAIIFIFILYYDAGLAFFYHGKFGVGVGTIILLINPTLLAAYTFGCHSFRHLVGGGTDCFSCSKTRYGLWKKVTYLNERHQLFAWLSLFGVGLTDVYVRLVSMGILHDFNTWNM
jgi:hypothetical protein